ncbi:MAG: hypothetical protein JWP75_1114 [Frondihabitans sp.]|nr:hypothetical protein [Frondihabitans sp.]
MTGSDPDARATRRATLSIGWQIMAASALLVSGIIVVATIFVLHQARPREQIDRDHSGLPHVYVDIDDVFKALVIIGIGAVVFAGLVSWFIARRAVGPLGQALRLQRKFVADASHELRTPLSVLDVRLQILDRRLRGASPPSTSETAEMVTELRSDSRALIDIVNDLLLTAGGGDRQGEPIAAGPVIARAVESLQILAAERSVNLLVEVDDTNLVRIPEASLRRCVIALVDNAVAHSPAGSLVTVTATRAGDLLRLVVADEGDGIRGITPGRVFDRFAHSTTTTTTPERTRPSFGIGLALVREIATRQGGRVRVEQTSPSGTTMVLELPVEFESHS